MSDHPPCLLCNHQADDHPVVGSPAKSPCQRCSCPGYVASRSELFRPVQPDAMERYPGLMSAETMHAVLHAEGTRKFGGEATLFGQFDDHPFFGNEGEQMIRGIEPGEVPKHMRGMMRVTPGGNLMLRYGKEHRNS